MPGRQRQQGHLFVRQLFRHFLHYLPEQIGLPICYVIYGHSRADRLLQHLLQGQAQIGGVGEGGGYPKVADPDNSAALYESQQPGQQHPVADVVDTSGLQNGATLVGQQPFCYGLFSQQLAILTAAAAGGFRGLPAGLLCAYGLCAVAASPRYCRYCRPREPRKAAR